jgi:hypothetical protein
MSQRARALILAAMVAAMNLAAVTAVAQAQTNDQPVRRPPTQGQVGESWHQAQTPADQPTMAGDTRRPPTEAQVGESWRQQGTAEEPHVAGDGRQPPTEAQVGESWRHPTSAPVPPAEPSGQPSWLIPSLDVLAAALVLAGGLAVLAARRAGRRARVGHAA